MARFVVFNPFEYALSAALVAGINSIGFGPGSTILYLSAGNGRLLEHLSNIVGPVRHSLHHVLDPSSSFRQGTYMRLSKTFNTKQTCCASPCSDLM